MAGPVKNGWVNVDISGADINHDLTKGVPLDDNTVDAVYSSHVFEHIPYRELLKVIKEINRVLKPGGYFVFNSAYVPDSDLPVYKLKVNVLIEIFQRIKKFAHLLSYLP